MLVSMGTPLQNIHRMALHSFECLPVVQEESSLYLYRGALLQ